MLPLKLSENDHCCIDLDSQRFFKCYFFLFLFIYLFFFFWGGGGGGGGGLHDLSLCIILDLRYILYLIY